MIIKTNWLVTVVKIDKVILLMISNPVTKNDFNICNFKSLNLIEVVQQLTNREQDQAA
jgi:hypothetical protein